MSESAQYYWKDKLFLIVEDDSASSMLLEIILSKTGAKLLFAESGEKAIEIVRHTRGIDLILLDIKMGGISGLQAAALIKDIAPSIPIIAQTACVVYGDKERCLQAGCSAYVPKPIMADILLDTIHKQINGSVAEEIYNNPYCSN